MTSPMFKMDCLRLLATSDNIRLLATELRTRLGIRIIQPHLHARHVGQIQIDLVRLGEALQHSHLLGPFISQPQSTTVAFLQHLFRQHSDRVRSASKPFWEDGMQHSCFLMGTGTLEDELGSMISAAIEAWEGERPILPPWLSIHMHGHRASRHGFRKAPRSRLHPLCIFDHLKQPLFHA